MNNQLIQNYDEFVSALLESGFSMGGGISKGIYSIIPFDWKTESPDTKIKWHTGDPETDPWEWRMRVLEERNDIAYAKLFFRTSGYITKQWYPYFLAVRRKGKSFSQAYKDGEISHTAKMIYDLVAENDYLPLHEIKKLGGFQKEDNSRFDRAITDLQMKMYLTMSGRTNKRNQYGEAYGWNVTVFTTPEIFFGKDLIDSAANLPAEEASTKIRFRIFQLNPEADEKNIKKFING